MEKQELEGNDLEYVSASAFQITGARGYLKRFSAHSIRNICVRNFFFFFLSFHWCSFLSAENGIFIQLCVNYTSCCVQVVLETGKFSLN